MVRDDYKFQFHRPINLLLSLTGNVLCAFELLPISSKALSINRRGQVKISMKFKSALDKPVNAIIFCMYQSMIEIGHDKHVILDR